MQAPGYHIERLVAEGGMSTVYRAVQESLGRRVALKVLKHIDSLEQAERFLREARIIAALEHRNIITIHDVGSVEDRYYIAMEYLEGGSLADRIERGLPADQALELVEAIAGCLDFVHRRGVVHRDIKPSNILFHADGTPKLSDFGIAKQLEADQERTMDGSTFGSPYYLSPEQAEGRPLDGRSDIYSLGIVFHQMLTGRRPYAESSHIETIVAHLSHPIPVLPEPFEPYQHLLEDMIAKDPDERIGSAAELVQRVRALRAGDPWAATGRDAAGHGQPRGSSASRAAAVAAFALLAGAAGLAWWALDPEPATVPSAPLQPVAATPAQVPADPPPVTPAVSPPQRGDAARPVATADPREPLVQPEVVEAVTDAGVDGSQAIAEAEPHGQVAAEVPDALRIVQAAGPVDDPAADEKDAGTRSFSVTSPGERVTATADAEAVEDGAAGTDPGRQIEALLQQAGAAMQALRLTRPAGNSAYDRYRDVLALAPDNPAALAGIDAIAARYAAMAQTAAAEANPQRARMYLRRGRQVRPDHPDLVTAEAAIAAYEQPQVAVDPAPPVTPPEPREDSLRGAGSGNIVQDFKKVWRSVFD